MPKYTIHFRGCPIGRLNTAWKDNVSRLVEADTPEEARLKAYETHEHIHNDIIAVMHDDCDNRGGACPECREGRLKWEKTK